MAENKTIKFGDICQEVKLSTKNPLQDGYDRYIGLEHLDSGSLKIKRWGNIVEDNPSFTRVFKKGHILFGKRRSYLKKAAIAEFDGICSSDIIVMEPKGDLMLPELLPFIVQSETFWDWAIKTSSESLSPRTKFKDISLFNLKLPNKEDQEKVLNILKKTLEVESLASNNLIICKNIFNRAVDSILFEPESDSREGFFGLYSSSFIETAFSELTKESAFGPRYPSDKYSTNGNIGTIRTTDFDDTTNINYETLPYAVLDESKFKEHLLQDGDLLITRSGTCGLVAVYRETGKKIIPGAFIIRFRLKKGVDPDYIKLFLMRHRVQSYISSLASGGVQKNLTSVNLLKIKIIMPTNAVINNIKQLQKTANSSQSVLNEKIKHLVSIRKALLTDWFQNVY